MDCTSRQAAARTEKSPPLATKALLPVQLRGSYRGITCSNCSLLILHYEDPLLSSSVHWGPSGNRLPNVLHQCGQGWRTRSYTIELLYCCLQTGLQIVRNNFSGINLWQSNIEALDVLFSSLVHQFIHYIYEHLVKISFHFLKYLDDENYVHNDHYHVVVVDAAIFQTAALSPIAANSAKCCFECKYFSTVIALPFIGISFNFIVQSFVYSALKHGECILFFS